MIDRSFPPTRRLRTPADFRRVFDHGKSASDGRLVVYAVTNELGRMRLGLSVSRKVGNAVVRNRWKRRIREAFRLQDWPSDRALDLVVIPRGALPTLAELAQSLSSLAAQAQRRLKRRPPQA